MCEVGAELLVSVPVGFSMSTSVVIAKADLCLGSVDLAGKHGEARHPEARHDLVVELGSLCNIANNRWCGSTMVLSASRCLPAILVSVGIS